MPLISNQPVDEPVRRTYHVQVPDTPLAASLPVIVVFAGGGQDVETIARRWGVDPPNPVPAALAEYLLVFPEKHPQLTDEWIHFSAGDSGFPVLDLDFVADLLADVTSRAYPTGSPTVPTVTGDPELVYAAGFSNGGGMVWQLLYSDLAARFRGFAAVGKALDPEKVSHYRRALPAGTDPAPAPVYYLHGTADHGYRPPFTQEEASVEGTLPSFTLREMLDRNVVPAGSATTRLITGSTGVTEVVLQQFAGQAAYVHGTVLNGGHNWPSPTTRGNPPVADHFDATLSIVEFWRTFAGLP